MHDANVNIYPSKQTTASLTSSRAQCAAIVLQRRQQASATHAGPAAKRQRGLAFAPSVLEAADAWQGELADYADEDDGQHQRLGYHHEIMSSDEDERENARAASKGPARLEGATAPAALLRARQGTMGNDSFIEGFVRRPMGREDDLAGVFGDLYAPPAPARAHGIAPRRVPLPQHRFDSDCAQWYGAPRAGAESAAVAAVKPPSDKQLAMRIDQIAALVARGGEAALQLAKQTHRGAPPHKSYPGCHALECCAMLLWRRVPVLSW